MMHKLCRNYVKFLVNGDGQAVKATPRASTHSMETDAPSLAEAFQPAERFSTPAVSLQVDLLARHSAVPSFLVAARPAIAAGLGRDVPAWFWGRSSVEYAGQHLTLPSVALIATRSIASQWQCHWRLWS
jgi:hypothetical protein